MKKKNSFLFETMKIFKAFGVILVFMMVISIVSISAYADNNNFTIVSAESGFSSVSQNTLKVKPNESTVMTVVAHGDDVSDVTYQWYRYNSDTNVNEEELGTEASQETVLLNSPASYRCKAIDKFGNTAWCYFKIQIDNNFDLISSDYSSSYSVTVMVAPGATATLNVRATGYDVSDVVYTWRRYSSNTNTEVLEETSSSMTTSEINKKWTYYCTARDKYGNSDSFYFYVQVENHFSLVVPNSGNQGNTTVYVAPGSTAELSVTATGDDLTGVTYRWSQSTPYKSLSAVTNSITTEEINTYHQYYCYATDRYGNTSYFYFYVRIQNHFSVSENTQKITVDCGDSTELAAIVTADDLTGATYKWTRRPMDNSGNTETLPSTTESLTTDILTKAYRYYCSITDKYGNSGTCSYDVMIENHFSLVSDFSGSSNRNSNTIKVPYLGSATLTVVANGDDLEGVTYSWNRYSQSGYTSDSWSSTSTTIETGPLERAYDYQCRAVDKYGNTTWCYFSVQIENHFTLVSSASGYSYLSYNTYKVPYNGTATLSVSAKGDDLEGVTYQWRRYKRDGNGYFHNIEDLSSTLPVLETDPHTESYSYDCRATDKYGNTAWCYFEVQIENHLSAVDPVTGSTYNNVNVYRVNPGESTTLSVKVTADDTSNLSYEWFRYWYDSAGQRQTEKIGTAVTQDTGVQTRSYDYRCDVTDCYGSMASCHYRVIIENHFTLVAKDTGVTWRDSNIITVAKNDTAILSVVAKADDLDGLTYTWYKGPYSKNGNDSIRVQENAPTIMSDAITETMGYTCVAVDKYGTEERCYFTVCVQNNFVVTTSGGFSYQYIDLLKNQTLEMEANVQADDKYGISYQWYKAPRSPFTNSNAFVTVPGATFGTLLSDPVSVATTYRCDVTDRYGTVASCWYYLGVENHFGLNYAVGTPGYRYINVFVKQGETATFEATPVGDDLSGITYEWRKIIFETEFGGAQFGPPIQGADSNILTTPVITDRTVYSVFAKDRYGNVANCAFQVSVENNVTVSAATDRFPVVQKGSSLTVRANVTANDPSKLTYKWYKSGPNSNRELIVDATGTSCTQIINNNCSIEFAVTDEYGSVYGTSFLPAISSFVTEKPNLHTVTSDFTGIHLEWDVIDGAAYYLIDRKASGENGWTNIAKISSGNVSYNDYALINGKTYSYRIQGGFSQHKTQASDVKTIQFSIPYDKVLTLPGAIKTIEGEAFLNVGAEAVLIPSSVNSIADNAFDSNIIIIGTKGSEAENYADRNGLIFISKTQYNG